MGRNPDPIWEEFSEFRPKSDTKRHPDVSCIHCHDVIMNAQPGRHLYCHIITCPGATAATKAKWSNIAAQKKHKAHSQDVPGFSSPTKVRRTRYGHSTTTK
ncbi:hypothetical protein PHMEG_00019616 [Phytophthora megakarya]|uniref:BED-type domain-containing protein n=1 Tax=Phytophthora megakarya TaxID=4795 RepID=A0A225VTQ3_9STRA|nr:hypothetical protein PHMEG_00019616 [Phytophthora megakarya]